MSCDECEHCQALAAKAALRITHRLRAGQGGTDVEFYRAFGAAYDLAVERHRQPMRAVRDANPDLSVHQCRNYLKRARQLGLVRTPPATGAPVTVRARVAGRVEDPPTVEAPPEDTGLARVLSNPSVQLMLSNSVPVGVQQLEALELAHGPEAERLAVLLAGH